MHVITTLNNENNKKSVNTFVVLDKKLQKEENKQH